MTRVGPSPVSRSHVPLQVGGLVVLALFLAGCGGGDKPAPTAPRFEAVKATPAPASLERWCDFYTPGAGAPRLELPPVAPARAGSPAFTLPTGKWVWVNLWATWCVPCKREMPMLVKWRDQLAKDGVGFELVFISVDDTAEGLARFFGEQPTMAPDPSLRLLQPKSLDSWLKRYEPEASGSVPVHLIAAPGGEGGCVRAGAIREGDYATVRALMR
ncbi:MAG TPA: thioredoxin-like domain-containing protein [Thermoanaerobaculaceae bacterium]|nr:thioredoxin-like domain-containing protein [Thermoanaerobaculaceae bacterium]